MATPVPHFHQPASVSMEMGPDAAADLEDLSYVDLSCGCQLGYVSTIFQTAPATL